MGRKPHRPNADTVSPAPVPANFHDRSRAHLGHEVDGLLEALAAPAPVSLRVNNAKWQGPENERVAWCMTGRYLNERPAFTFDPRLHAGHYYVQEASSMLLEQAVRASGLDVEPIIALDLCAAPGGKSTHLRSLLHNDALLVSNEIDRKRRSILQENVWKWGAANHMVTGAAPALLHHLPEQFDLILVDAPCSGEGMFRKDAYAREQWSPELVERCSFMQRDALRQAWYSLKPGGSLIYSTCTWEVQENEERVAELMEQGAISMRIPIDPTWGVLRTDRMGVDGLRCYPHRLRGEGFFMAMVRKPGERAPILLATDAQPQDHPQALHGLRPDRPWHALEHDGTPFAVDGRWVPFIQWIGDALPVLSPGIALAERKANTWRPHEALALAQDLQRSHFQEVELDLEQAIGYLRGLALPAQDARGTALITHGGAALGWAQGAGNRWNNRWPAAWRVRSQHPNAPPVSWAQR